ncbi:zinc finger protein 106 isoform X3 [Danio aesculapii]|uniref:zinc finger protein 106 isoform X3 n=1 Tax=Danio aesculapii TaxID=1142201 RepID=UPI0024BF2F85|nr:zinc finger protein 106 isoform X3 [Danio aesculapii]
MKAKPNQAKAKTKKKRNYVHVKPNIGRNYRRCLICGQQYGEKNLSSHIHSYVHHEAIEHIKGSKQLHNCFACDVSVMGLEMYEEHISTPEHTHRLFLLHTKGKQKQLREDYNIVLTKDELRALKIRQQRKQQHKDCSTCFVCCKSFPVQDIDVHMNGCLHHQMIEQLKGRRNMEKRKCWGKGAQAKTTYNSTYWSTPVVVNEFTNAKNRNDSPTSTQLIQILSKWRQEGMRDMDNLNGPLVKPAEHRPPEVSAHTTHPNPEKRGGDVYDVTPETEGGASVEPSCSPALVQSRLEAHRYSLTTTARQDCTNQKKTTEHEAVVLQHPQEKAINAVFEPMARKEMNEVQPHSDSLPSVSSLPETALENQTSKNDSRVLETAENVQPHAVCMKRKKSNESEKEQSETFLENHNIQTTKKRKQDISHNGHNPNPERNGKIFKKGNVNKLLALSLKEDELTRSLENVGDQLIQAHSILQSTYTEVQRLLAVKQQVTSEMASLREKRMKILQQMKSKNT